MAIFAVAGGDAMPCSLGAPFGRSVVAVLTGAGHGGVVGRCRDPAAGGMARITVFCGRHVSAGLVPERREGNDVAAHASGRSLPVRERGFVAGEGLRRNKVAGAAHICDKGYGVVQTTLAFGSDAIVAGETAAGHLIVINDGGPPRTGTEVAGVAHGR